MPGFGFAETMTGTWTRTDGAPGGGQFEFAVQAQTGGLRSFQRTGMTQLTGTVTADGLARARPLTGTLEIRPWRGRVLRYDFSFDGTDGVRYRFAGQKDLLWLAPVRSWTELPGTITGPQGRVIGTAATRFDLRRRGPAFVRSFRLRS